MKKTTLYSLLFILFVNFIVFFPVFSHPPRGSDHHHYLVETNHIDKFSDLLLYSYSYPRVRKLASGDEILFRPLFYALLASETWFFRYDTFYWQVTALFLHLLVLWQVIRILSLFTRGLLPFLAVLCFSVLYISQEMVSWHHINGYILFLIFFLNALYYLLLYFSGHEKNIKHLTYMTFFLTLSCFTYEVGVIYSLVLFAILLAASWNTCSQTPVKRLWTILRAQKLFVFFIPVITYYIISGNDYLLRIGSGKFQNAQFFGFVDLAHFDIRPLVYIFCKIAYYGIGGILFPCFTQMYPYSKTRLDGFSLKPVLMTNGITQTANAIFGALLLGILTVAIFRAIQGKNRPRPISLQNGLQKREQARLVTWIGTALLFTHILLLTFGRSQLFNYITVALYHYYILGIFLLLSCSRWLYSFEEKFLNKKAILKYLIMFLVCLCAFLNGFQTYKLNQIRKDVDGKWNRYIREVNYFIKKHKKEEDFSFNIFWSQQRRGVHIYVGNPDADIKYTGFFVDFLFRKYIDPLHPKYFIVYSDKDQLAFFKDAASAEKYLLLTNPGIKKILPIETTSPE